MARDTGAQCKQCRREGQKLFLKGSRCFTDKCGVERRSYPPGEHGRGRMRQSEYRVQLREKQKARRYYGVLEKQFRHYYEKASRQEGITGENLLTLLERRFDNVLVRLGFSASRRQARQLIRHGHWTINGRRVDIPSYQVRDGDVIAVKVGTGADAVIRDATELTAQVTADSAARKGMEHGLQKVDVYVKGPGSGRETAIRSLQAAGLEVTSVRDVTPQAHNGCRPRKRRRV